MDDSKVFMFPEGNKGVDATTALLLGNNGGFGGYEQSYVDDVYVPIHSSIP